MIYYIPVYANSLFYFVNLDTIVLVFIYYYTTTLVIFCFKINPSLSFLLLNY